MEDYGEVFFWLKKYLESEVWSPPEERERRRKHLIKAMVDAKLVDSPDVSKW
jgi:hypothetical protein